MPFKWWGGGRLEHAGKGTPRVVHPPPLSVLNVSARTTAGPIRPPRIENEQTRSGEGPLSFWSVVTGSTSSFASQLLSHFGRRVPTQLQLEALEQEKVA